MKITSLYCMLLAGLASAASRYATEDRELLMPVDTSNKSYVLRGQGSAVVTRAKGTISDAYKGLKSFLSKSRVTRRSRGEVPYADIYEKYERRQSQGSQIRYAYNPIADVKEYFSDDYDYWNNPCFNNEHEENQRASRRASMLRWSVDSLPIEEYLGDTSVENNEPSMVGVSWKDLESMSFFSPASKETIAENTQLLSLIDNKSVDRVKQYITKSAAKGDRQFMTAMHSLSKSKSLLHIEKVLGYIEATGSSMKFMAYNDLAKGIKADYDLIKDLREELSMSDPGTEDYQARLGMIHIMEESVVNQCEAWGYMLSAPLDHKNEGMQQLEVLQARTIVNNKDLWLKEYKKRYLAK